MRAFIQEKKILLIGAFLVIATLIAYWHAKDCAFVSFDDYEYVSQNSHIQSGVTVDAVRWAFTAFHAANWHPLTWISHMIDVDLFGLNPEGHHVMNLLFHIANTLLLFFVLHRMTKAVWQSAFVAALFALHPLHVESVAWVAERKDVLSTFFWMLTLCAYCYYAERRSLWRYLLVMLFLALGLMSKPMLVTLPFVLVLLDYWPLGRFDQERSREKIEAALSKATLPDKGPSGKKRTAIKQVQTKEKVSTAADRPSLIIGLLWEKIPLFVLIIASSIITFLVQQRWGAVRTVENLPFSHRVANAFVSYIAYIEKMIWPGSLAVFYPYPKEWPAWQIFGAVAFFVVATCLVLWKTKRYRYLAVGWLWYVGTLVPVIGLLQVGEQARADRYTYIPLIGLFIIAAWSVPELLGRWRHSKKILAPLAAVVVLCLLISTRTQVTYWQNSLTLFDRALRVTKSNHVAYFNRGYAFATGANQEKAIQDYNRAIEINPRYASAYNNRGMAYAAQGNHEKAIADYSIAIEIDSTYALAYNNRGISRDAVGDHLQAIQDYDRALAIDPDYVSAYINRANAYAGTQGSYAQAVTDYDKALRINPRSAPAYANRGNAYAALGDQAQAVLDYDRALAIDPGYLLAYYNRGNAYGALGNQERAIKDFDRAIALDPRYAPAYSSRGNAYAAIGNQAEAIKNYDRALAIDPKLSIAYVNRGMAYAASGNQRQAIADYDKAIRMNPRLAFAYRVRAVSYDKLGNRTRAYEDLKAAASLGDKAAQNYLGNQGMGR